MFKTHSKAEPTQRNPSPKFLSFGKNTQHPYVAETELVLLAPNVLKIN